VAKGREVFRGAKKSQRCADYVFAAQTFMSVGDFRAAKAALDEAVTLFPNQDGPHFLLAEFYYRLAFFDVIKRDLHEARLVPVTELATSQLKAGHLRLELDELTDAGRPREYAALLQNLGVDQQMQIAIDLLVLASNKEGLPAKAREFLPEMIEKAGGVAKAVPVVSWSPDEQTNAILGWAAQELDLAAKGSRMSEPPGFRLIQKDRFQALSVQIDRLLGKNTPTTSSGAPANDDHVLELARRIADEGTASIPGLAPDPKDPDNVLSLGTKEGTEVSFTTEVFSVKANWCLTWKAGPALPPPNVSYFKVQLFLETDEDQSSPKTIANETLSNLPMFRERIESDMSIFPRGGNYFLRVSTNVPYALDVRDGR